MKELVHDKVVECEEHRHAEYLEPEDGSKQDHNLEGHDDALHRQQPAVHMES